jgi:hypothetical protein
MEDPVADHPAEVVAAAPVPFLSDAAGLGADAVMHAQDPASRTWDIQAVREIIAEAGFAGLKAALQSGKAALPAAALAPIARAMQTGRGDREGGA